MTVLMRAGAAALLLALLLPGAQAGIAQSFHLRVPVPPSPVPVAGSLRLIYELHLTNFSDRPLTLTKLEVRAADAADACMILGPAELSQRLFRPGPRSDKPVFAPGTTGVVYIELTFQGTGLPETLEHRVSFTGTGEDDAMTTVRGARVTLRNKPPLVLSPPLRGGPWVAVYDPNWPRGHRRVIYAVEGRATIPGRYAIDWIRIDDDGRFASGDADRIRNWLGYGADVLAAADGVVAGVRDDVPESKTVSGHPEHALEDATGNYVVLDAGHGRFVFYEHLKPGSVRVEAGEHVTAGQVIGALGFTGSSTGPHLHFHVAGANSALGAEGLPFVLDRFVMLGRYDDFDRLGSAPWAPADTGRGATRREERPGSNTVVVFPVSGAEQPVPGTGKLPAAGSPAMRAPTALSR